MTVQPEITDEPNIVFSKMNTFWWSIDPVNGANRFYSSCDTQKLEAAFASRAPSCILEVSKAFLKQRLGNCSIHFIAAAFRKIHRGFQIDGPDQSRGAFKSCLPKIGLVQFITL